MPLAKPALFRSLAARLLGAAPPVPAKDADGDLLRQASRQFQLGRRDIETTFADPAAARSLMERVITQWRKLGETDPFWSNDTRDEFKREKLDAAAIRTFYRIGEEAAHFLDAFGSRSGVKIAGGTCVELGCGVGKHTPVLARAFARVIAIDVSPGGLALCERRMKDLGVGNVTTMLLTTPDDIARCGMIDLFFSLSVLQHNPPPLQKLMLDLALASLRPGGFCLFQTPDWIENYTFSTAQFLSAPDAMFDLHCLPKTDVLRLLEARDMQLLDFAPDFTIGSFGSYTYFAQKRGGAAAETPRIQPSLTKRL